MLETVPGRTWDDDYNTHNELTWAHTTTGTYLDNSYRYDAAGNRTAATGAYTRTEAGNIGGRF